MTSADPKDRPTADVTLDYFREICSKLDPSVARRQVRRRDESIPELLVNTTLDAVRAGFNTITRLITQ